MDGSRARSSGLFIAVALLLVAAGIAIPSLAERSERSGPAGSSPTPTTTRPSPRASLPSGAVPTPSGSPLGAPPKLTYERTEDPRLPVTWYRWTAVDGSFSIVGPAPGTFELSADRRSWTIQMAGDPVSLRVFVFPVQGMDAPSAIQMARSEVIAWGDDWFGETPAGHAVTDGTTRGWEVSADDGAGTTTLRAFVAGNRMVVVSAHLPTGAGPKFRYEAKVFLGSIRIPADVTGPTLA